MGYRLARILGSEVELFVSGPSDARDLLVFHVGSPSAGVVYPGLTAAAAARGLRTVTYSRAGYGRSERVEGRTVADEARVTAAVADLLGHDRFFTIGWSGGGPPALAAAALLPKRVRAAAALASMAPIAEAGDAWRTFWTPEQRHEWEDLVTGNIEKLTPDFEGAVAIFRGITVRRLGRLGGAPDDRAIAYHHDTEVIPPLVRSMRRAVSTGHFGYLDDNLAQARDWGFRVADIEVPMVVRHGELDRLVPVANGRWLATAVPNARATFLPDAGHGSIVLPWSDVIDELLATERV